MTAHPADEATPPPSADKADLRRNDDPRDEPGAETESPFASEGGRLRHGLGTPRDPDEPAREE